jgi:hypothetical protein
MYCPECHAEYRDGFTECADCQVPLLSGIRQPEPSERPAPDSGLVVVLETNNRIQLALAKGLLEDSDIPFFVLGQITTFIQDVDGFLHKFVRVQVPCDREVEARELLASLLNPDSSFPGAAEEEPNSSGESVG